MATPHISAEKGAFADAVLMPGDPLRARYIAEHFLQDAQQITAVRNMYGYTGFYQNQRVSVMAHGMGIPSCSIYATELITEYGVKNLIRIGSCGAVRDDVKVRDVLIALGASTDSRVNRLRFNGSDFAAIADFGIVQTLVQAASANEIPVRVGLFYTSDLFYHPDGELTERLRRYGVLGVEMETAGLYGVAAEYGAKAATVCTVSDHMVSGESLDSGERQTSFNQMIRIALDAAVRLN